MLGRRRPDEVRGEARVRRVQARRDARGARRRRPCVPRAVAGRARCGGWGRRPARRSADSGIRTVGDLGRTPESILERLLGRGVGAITCHELAHGVDDRDVVPYEAPKSVSHEETFERDLDADEDILRELLDLSGRVATRLREDGYRARTVVLKVRLANFQTLTRSRTLPDATDIGADLYRIVVRAVRALPGPAPADPAAGCARRPD